MPLRTIVQLKDKVINIAREDGFIALAKRTPPALYRRKVRPLLPDSGRNLRNGVPAEQQKKLFDDYLPYNWHGINDRPNYENALVNLHQVVTKPGDNVIIIAGGYGISTYYAAKSVGEKGQVIVFEGSTERFEYLKEFTHRIGISDIVDVNEAIVGEDIKVYDNNVTDNRHSPEELPPCDVLELDCEGAEMGILSNMNARPRDIFVEVHPHLEPETKYVPKKLDEMSYNIRQRMGHNGTKFTSEETEYMLKYDRENNTKETPLNTIHPPVFWAEKCCE